VAIDPCAGVAAASLSFAILAVFDMMNCSRAQHDSRPCYACLFARRRKSSTKGVSK
jgi:hypothetical protein